MSLLAFLSSAIGGTLLSGVQQMAQEWFATRRLKAESEIKLNEAKVLAEIKMDENQWKAFSEAQRGAVSSNWVPSSSTPQWLACLFGLAEIAIKMVRPAMVVAAFALVAYTYADAAGDEKAELVAAIQTFCFSVGYFWLGQRYQGKISSTSLRTK